jgi:hypothetical protein
MFSQMLPQAAAHGILEELPPLPPIERPPMVTDLDAGATIQRSGSGRENSQTFALGLHWACIGHARTYAHAHTLAHEKTSLYYYYYKMCAVVCAVVCVVGCVVSIGETLVFIGISLCRAVCRWL